MTGLAVVLVAAACAGPHHGRTSGGSSRPAITGPPASPPVSSTTPNASSPCGAAGAPSAPIAHVVWIFMESHTETEIVGSAQAPFETAMAHSCATATHWSAVGKPSLPNYLGATSGTASGIHDDAPPPAHPLTIDNLFRQVRTGGHTERSYEEAMPGPCALLSSGRYGVRHNPAAYYQGADDRAACGSDDVPLGTATAGALHDDLAADRLPQLSVITPDVCHDTHDCAVPVGDQWLSVWLPLITASPAYRSGGTVVFVVWDEPTPVANLVIAPTVRPATVVTAPVDHYSLLRTTEEMLGLPLLAGARGSADLRSLLGL